MQRAAASNLLCILRRKRVGRSFGPAITPTLSYDAVGRRSSSLWRQPRLPRCCPCQAINRMLSTRSTPSSTPAVSCLPWFPELVNHSPAATPVDADRGRHYRAELCMASGLALMGLVRRRSRQRHADVPRHGARAATFGDFHCNRSGHWDTACATCSPFLTRGQDARC